MSDERGFQLEIMNAVRDGLREAVKAKMSGYNSPLDDVLRSVISDNFSGIRKLLHDSVSKALSDEEFRASLATATRHSLARQLIQKFGGELEKQVNALKSDPATRARITLAIEDIVSSASK